jgi:hypothetical protein
MGAFIAGVSRLRRTNNGADHCRQIYVESLLKEIACHQEMQVDVKGVLYEMKMKKVRDWEGTGLFWFVLPSKQPKNAISRAALVSITVSMFNSKHKEKSSLQSP